MVDGILPVYKPVGISSFDVIRRFKRDTLFRGKVGHAGTLDVFACGVLIILLGKMTKEFDAFKEFEKVYVASAKLGYKTETQDIEGDFKKHDQQVEKLKKEDIKKAMKTFTKEYNQKIPKFSASKYKGKPSYQYALEDIEPEEREKEVTIHDIDLLSYMHPLVTYQIVCSSGTYIRQLNEDIFSSLNQYSFLWYLERTEIGEITKEDCVEMAAFQDKSWEDFLFTIDRNQP